MPKKRIPEYGVWNTMIQRCHNPNTEKYPKYGGRGIRVCKRWRDSFEEFLKDVGRRPSARHQISRVDNDGNYESGNVQWDLPSVQALNKSSNVRITVGGITKTVTEFAREKGLTPKMVFRRLTDGWSAEHALTPPVHHYGRHRGRR